MVIDDLEGFLEEQGIAHAVIGGVALASYGIARTTYDLDLVAPRAAQQAIIDHLETLGYRTLYRSPGFSNHLHGEPERGRVDLVYVDEGTGEQLFAAVRLQPGPGGRRIPVPCPEHLAAMKVLAMKNDPERTYQDLADLRKLLRLPDIDREAVRHAFLKHDLGERFDELEATL